MSFNPFAWLKKSEMYFSAFLKKQFLILHFKEEVADFRLALSLQFFTIYNRIIELINLNLIIHCGYFLFYFMLLPFYSERLLLTWQTSYKVKHSSKFLVQLVPAQSSKYKGNSSLNLPLKWRSLAMSSSLTSSSVLIVVIFKYIQILCIAV